MGNWDTSKGEILMGELKSNINTLWMKTKHHPSCFRLNSELVLCSYLWSNRRVVCWQHDGASGHQILVPFLLFLSPIGCLGWCFEQLCHALQPCAKFVCAFLSDLSWKTRKYFLRILLLPYKTTLRCHWGYWLDTLYSSPWKMLRGWRCRMKQKQGCRTSNRQWGRDLNSKIRL